MFRVQTLNILLHIAEEFSQLLGIKRLLDSHEEGDLEYMMDKLMSFFANIGPCLDQELPKSPYANSLDKRMRALRKKELHIIKNDLFQMEKDLTNAKSESKMKLILTILEGLTNHLSSIKHLCIEVIHI